MTDYKEVRTTEHEEGREQRVATFKATQLIWLLLGLLEGVLALRFVFKLIGVNAANSFATLLYGVTGFFTAPFASLTGTPAAGGMVLDAAATAELCRAAHDLFSADGGGLCAGLCVPLLLQHDGFAARLGEAHGARNQGYLLGSDATQTGH